MIAPLIDGINAHLNALQVYNDKADYVRALGAAEQAKKLLQELYYEVWMNHHKSGTGGGG